MNRFPLAILFFENMLDYDRLTTESHFLRVDSGRLSPERDGFYPISAQAPCAVGLSIIEPKGRRSYIYVDQDADAVAQFALEKLAELDDAPYIVSLNGAYSVDMLTQFVTRGSLRDLSEKELDFLRLLGNTEKKPWEGGYAGRYSNNVIVPDLLPILRFGENERLINERGHKEMADNVARVLDLGSYKAFRKLFANGAWDMEQRDILRFVRANTEIYFNGKQMNLQIAPYNVSNLHEPKQKEQEQEEISR